MEPTQSQIKCLHFKCSKLWHYTAPEVEEEEVIPWFQEDLRGETVCLCAVSLCPSLRNRLVFHTSAWTICELLNLQPTSPEDNKPCRLCWDQHIVGERQHHLSWAAVGIWWKDVSNQSPTVCYKPSESQNQADVVFRGCDEDQLLTKPTHTES